MLFMKKVLFITHDDMSGGSAKSLLAQIKFFFENKTVEPVVVTWTENSLTTYLRKIGVQCYALKYDFTSVWTRNKFLHLIKKPYYRLFYNYLAYKTLKKKIDFSKISLIVSNSSVIDFGAYLHRKLQIPHVWYLREFGDLDFNILPYIKNLPYYIEKNSDGIIAVSEAVASHWRKRGIKRKINVVYDGVVDKINFRTIENNKSIVRICMCGRLSPAKGQILAIKALLFLPQSILERIHIDFFGKGESEEKLRAIVKQKNLEKFVSFKGFSHHLDEELDDYEIGLTLSAAEAFGRTTIEYMGHALFVIGTNTGGTPELLQNGKYGLLIAPNSPEMVAKSIIDYFNNRKECLTKAVQGQSYAYEKFIVKKCAEQAYSYYNSFIK